MFFRKLLIYKKFSKNNLMCFSLAFQGQSVQAASSITQFFAVLDSRIDVKICLSCESGKNFGC